MDPRAPHLSRRLLLRGALSVAAGALATTVLAACTSKGTNPVSASTAPGSAGTPLTSPRNAATAGPSGSRVLLAYFSRPGENYNYGGRIDLKVGNTQVLAEMIAARTQLDVYRIQPADPYPDSYEQTVARNVQEEQDDARPKIAGALPSLDGYDTILLGSPVWNSQEPMIMRTFIDSFDWTGKTVQPFVTYAVSRMGAVRSDYARLCTGAAVGDGLAVQGETVRDSAPDAEAWLRQIGLA